MSAPGEAAGSYRTVSIAIDSLEKQGFKFFNEEKLYRVIRDHHVYDAFVDVRDPLKKVVVRVIKKGKRKRRKQ